MDTQEELRLKAQARRRRAEAEEMAARAARDAAEANRAQYKGPAEEATGLADAALSLGTGAIAAPVSGLIGLAGTMLPGPEGQGARWQQNVQEAMTYEPRTEVGQRTLAGISAPFEAIERGADYVGEVSGDPDDVLGATAVKTGLLAIPTMLGLRGGRAPAKLAPTVDELGTRATAAYTRANNMGMVVKPQAVQNAVRNIQNELAKEGLDPTLHAGTTAAMKRLQQAADDGRPLSLQELDTLRQIIKDAYDPMKPGDARVASIARGAWDEFIEGLDPSQIVANADPRMAVATLTEARQLWGRKRKGEVVEELMERAELSRNQPAGYEAALRQEFKTLARNPRKMKAFTPEEQKLIRAVVSGGPLENAMQIIGRSAPRTAMSAALNVGAGAAIAGPVGALAVPVLTETARQGASALTRGNVTRLSERVRGGSPHPAGPDPIYGRSARAGALTQSALESSESYRGVLEESAQAWAGR